MADIRVMIVEDDDEIREGLSLLLGDTDGYTCTGSFESQLLHQQVRDPQTLATREFQGNLPVEHFFVGGIALLTEHRTRGAHARPRDRRRRPRRALHQGVGAGRTKDQQERLVRVLETRAVGL